MTESLSNASEKLGFPPGSLIHVGEILEPITKISVINYNKETLEEREIQSIDEVFQYKDSDTITWVIIEGLTNVEFIERIGAIFGIHQLVLEDILNTHQRTKLEEHDDYLYIVLKSLVPEDNHFSITYEQISLLVLKNFVFAFKEKKDELFVPVVQRIKTGNGRFRSLGSDYLTYAILDTVVDQYFVMIDSLDEAISSLEDNLLSSEPTKNIIYTIQILRREIITIRRNISPTRELMSGLLRSESELIDEKTQLYLRDVSDHAIRVMEMVESYRDILSGLIDIYVSSVSNKLNEIMKVLTVFASIFIPLTFLAGIYGMNFDYMPELKWKWAYPTLWIIFITIPIVLIFYFKKKKWL
ncbi:MAG: magnesium/cobalt transporter CorA [Nitrosomonas sp.]|nr:magnesium/cobalt transporter CorA [Nitrosomonas sp.]